ncbi:hypothetical protein [Spiractinospora alimapuensis]|uniref:hypothetical protein n=1 Tax=Spiractinospora alimapuensis TaxID=2820884 RepID=UPI002ED70769
MRENVDRVLGLPRLHDDVARLVLTLLEPPSQRLQHRVVAELPQCREFAQLRGHHAHLGPRADTRDPTITDRVDESAVHPVDAASCLHPGQQPQQPP